MLKSIAAAALVVGGPAYAAAGDDYQAQMYRDPFYYTQNQNKNSNQDNPAFTQGCPRGSIPEPFPNSLGRRCALPGGGYTY